MLSRYGFRFEEKGNDGWGIGTTIQAGDISPLVAPFYGVKAGTIDLFPGVLYDLNTWINIQSSTALTDTLVFYAALHSKFIYPTMSSSKYNAFSLRYSMNRARTAARNT